MASCAAMLILLPVEWHQQIYLGTTRRRGAKIEGGANQQCALTHATDSGSLVGQPEAAAVVTDPKTDSSLVVAQADLHVVGVGMAGNVRQSFLGNPIDHKLGLLVQHGQTRLEIVTNRETGVRGQLGHQRSQSTDETKILQHTWPQPPRQPAYLVQALPGRLLSMEQVRAQVGVVHPPGRSFEFQQYGGQALADLVVQLLSDPSPLRLLGRQRPGTAGGTFCLQPRQHLVEGTDQLRDTTLTGDWQPLSGLEQINRRHSAAQPVQRSQP